MNQNQQNIDPKLLSQSEEIVCKCGGKIFTEGYQIRTISKFLTGTPKDALIPMGVFYCVKCFEIPEQFKPKLPS